jgi:hypothetical protein
MHYVAACVCLLLSIKHSLTSVNGSCALLIFFKHVFSNYNILNLEIAASKCLSW